MSNSATTPSVGRILHYIPMPYEALTWLDQKQPLAAQIILTHGDGKVDVVVWDQSGRSHCRKLVDIVPPEGIPPNRGFCRWMPYQVAVARGDQAPVQHAAPATSS